MSAALEEVEDKKLDVVTLGIQHRAFCIELKMRRDQVNQLRQDLDAAHKKAHELTNSLEAIKKSKEEVEFHFNISMMNTRSLEEKMNSNKDFIIKNRVNQEALENENRILKGLLEKAERENYEKLKKIEDMETQQYCNTVFQRDILDQNGKMRLLMDKCNDMLQKVSEKHNRLLEFSTVHKTNKTLQESVEHYKQENSRIKRASVQLENKFVEAESLWKTYKSIIDSMDFCGAKKDEFDLVVDEILKDKNALQEEVAIKEETIALLNGSLEKQKDVNVKLWEKLETLEREKESMKMREQKVDSSTDTNDLFITNNLEVRDF